MQSVMIFYAQSLTEAIDDILTGLSIRGYSKWKDLTGRGSIDGEPHFGTHAWPALNSAIMCVIQPDKVEPLLEALRELDSRTSQQGLRAYTWDIKNVL